MVFENCAKFPRNFKFYRLFRVCSKDEKKVYVECYKSQTYFKSRVYKKKTSKSIHSWSYCFRKISNVQELTIYFFPESQT